MRWMRQDREVTVVVVLTVAEVEGVVEGVVVEEVVEVAFLAEEVAVLMVAVEVAALVVAEEVAALVVEGVGHLIDKACQHLVCLMIIW